MNNEIREKDHEWVKDFHSNFDRLLASLEKLLSQHQPSVYGDELLTDKEVAYLLKVSRRTLLDYRNNGILHAGGRQNPIPNFRHRTYPDEWVQGSIQMQRKRMIFLEGAQFAVCLFHPVFKKRPFPIKI